MNKLGWRLMSHAQAGLPVLLAAAAAGFTWWLVQSSPNEVHAASAGAPPSVADYEMNQARVARVDRDGRLQAVVNGRAMRHYPDQDRLQIDQLSLSVRGHQGQGLHATSTRGEASGQTEVIDLIGGAEVVATPASGAAATSTVQGVGLRGGPLRFKGESLKVDTAKRIVSSDTPVELTQTHSLVQARSLRYDDNAGIAELKGHVRGRYELTAR